MNRLRKLFVGQRDAGEVDDMDSHRAESRSGHDIVARNLAARPFDRGPGLVEVPRSNRSRENRAAQPDDRDCHGDQPDFSQGHGHLAANENGEPSDTFVSTGSPLAS